MSGVDHIMSEEVPYYQAMKKSMRKINLSMRDKSNPKKKKKKTTLTEYSDYGRKPVLKGHVTVNQAARKLYQYEQTGLSPYEIETLVERERNLTERLKRMEQF